MSENINKLRRMLKIKNWYNPETNGYFTPDGNDHFGFIDLCQVVQRLGIENDLPKNFNRKSLQDFLGTLLEGDWNKSTNGEIKEKLNFYSSSLFEEYREQVEEYIKNFENKA